MFIGRRHHAGILNVISIKWMTNRPSMKYKSPLTLTSGKLSIPVYVSPQITVPLFATYPLRQIIWFVTPSWNLERGFCFCALLHSSMCEACLLQVSARGRLVKRRIYSAGQFQRYSRYICPIFLFHWATIKHLDGQSNKFKAYDDLGVQLYITT